MNQYSALTVALIGAVLASASHAADVKVYGQIDTGLSYRYTSVALVADGDPVPGQDINDPHASILLQSKNKEYTKLGLDSGMMGATYLGFRVEERLANRVKVGAVLETNFGLDSGALAVSNKLFDREASLFVKTDFAMLTLGRTGMLRSGAGSTGLLKDPKSAFGLDGWGPVQGLNAVFGGESKVIDNAITLQIPVGEQWSLYAQYSGSADDNYRYDPDKQGHYNPEPGPDSVAPTENKDDADRYYSLAATYQGSNTQLAVIGDYMNFSNHRGSSDHGARPGSTSTEYHPARSFWSVTGVGSVQVGDLQYFAAAQYFESAQVVGANQLAMPQSDRTRTKVICYGAGGDGYSLTLGSAWAIGSGHLRGSISYLYAETSEHSAQKWGEMNRYVISLGYDHALSARTTLYSGVSYMHDSYNYTYTPHGKYFDTLPDAYEIGASFGIKHQF